MNDALHYCTVEELQQMEPAELTALWELVPTERQRRYKAVYDREVRHAGASGSDALEKAVAGELLTRYAETALIPIGARWARTPARIQEAARNNAELVAPEALEAQRQPGRPTLAIFAGGLVFLVMVFILLPRLGGRTPQVANLTTTATTTLTATLAHSPTPTPIALEQQDPVIRGGDGDRAAAFPVNLRVSLPDARQPRVFVVQRRLIQTAEWNFDSNPDTASYIAGLAVRPVIGVPYSAENADLFKMVAKGTTLTLQMNTGATLRFTFEGRLEVRRSDTGIFRQIGPGLVLVLIGERGEDGTLTATRTVITATYLPEQELARDGALSGLLPKTEPTSTPTPAPTVRPASQLDVQVIAVETVPGRLTAHLRLFNGQAGAVRITPDMVWLALGYAPEPPGPRVSAEGLPPFDLLPGQAADMTIHWPWAGEPFAGLSVEDYQYAMILGR
jgi:hypothetical protein